MSERDHAEEAGVVRTGIAVSAVICLAEVVGGWATNSLALLTDGVHMLTDVAALGLTWFSLWIGTRPANPQKTFGYYRAEILAAFVNGVVLCGLVAFIVVEAWQRLHTAPPVAARGMLAIAALGLAVNAFVAMRLHAHRQASLTLRGAYLHVLSDLLGSGGALAASLVILFTGWTPVDALVGMGIAGLILRGAWGLVGEALDVLMEGVPAHVDVEALQRALEAVDGVAEIHDLHVWTLTTGRYALSAHAVLDPTRRHDAVLDALTELCRTCFRVDHVTIQLEGENRRPSEPVH